MSQPRSKRKHTAMTAEVVPVPAKTVVAMANAQREEEEKESEMTKAEEKVKENDQARGEDQAREAPKAADGDKSGADDTRESEKPKDSGLAKVKDGEKVRDKDTTSTVKPSSIDQPKEAGGGGKGKEGEKTEERKEEKKEEKREEEKKEKREEEDSETGEVARPEKRPRLGDKEKAERARDGKTLEEIAAYLEDTFDVRRSFITVEMPGIPTVKETYPYLFQGKQLLAEFQRVTKVDIDHTIQEYCVKFAAAIVDCAKTLPGANAILKQAEAAKQENVTLRQYWDMVTSLCLLPLLFQENMVEMVREIRDTEEVEARGIIVPILIVKGSVFSSDQFILVAEECVLQEFEEFTMAFAALFSSYWVFNLEYPRTLALTYGFVQKAILHVRDMTPIPPPCKQLMQRLQKWSKATTSRRK